MMTEMEFQIGDEITFEKVTSTKEKGIERSPVDGFYGGLRSNGSLVLFLFSQPGRALGRHYFPAAQVRFLKFKKRETAKSP